MNNNGRIAVIQSKAVAYPRNQAMLKVFAEFVQKDAKSVFIMWPASHMLLKTFTLKYILGKYIVFDAFTSMYDSSVNDRKTVKQNSLKAFYLYIQDYLFCHLADHLVFDTEGHKNYFFKTFKLKSTTKYSIIPVCIDLERIDGVSIPQKGACFKSDKTNILFYGSFIPLQGIQYIIEAANLTRDLPVHFWILGKGQMFDEMHALAERLQVHEHLTFLPSIDYDELISHIKEADICLGIFGNTDKAQRVIPNKVLECAACSKPVITGSNPELEKYFKNDESIFFCPMANTHAIADRIRQVSSDVARHKSVGDNARKIVEQNFSLVKLRELLITII